MTAKGGKKGDPIAEALEGVPSRKERLQKALGALESQLAILTTCTTEWKELDAHFVEVEKTVQKRFDELIEKEKALELKTKEMQEALDRRDEAISAREQASLARVQEQKDAAIASIVEEKRKWNEEKQHLDNAYDKSPARKCAADSSELDSKVDVKGNVTDSKGEVKGLPNGSVSQVHEDEEQKLDSCKPDSSCEDSPKIPSPKAASPKQFPPRLASPKAEVDTFENDSITGKEDGNASPNSAVPEVRVRPQLKALCENMDGEGLRKYVVDHRKDVNALRAELPVALQCAIDPASLVLQALEGYYHPEQGMGDKKESGASANRRACVLILESAALALADPVLGVDHPVVPPNIKERAKGVADRWRSKMDILKEASSENSLDAQAFLQLLATYNIASEYDEEELCKLVTAVAWRRQSPALCRALGLSAKIPDVVDQLSRDGKQIEALSFAHAFGIMDRIQPVPLLKTYLKEARKTAQTILKNGNNSAAAQNDSSMKELSALKSVIKCIEEYKLESQYPTMPLQKRLDLLEKAKADRKRAAGAVKAQSKRPRASNANGGGYAGSATAERSFYRAADMSQYGGISSYGYDRRGQSGYATAYGGSRTPVSMSGSYLYSVDGLGSSVYGNAAYTTPSAAYSGYQFGSGLPPPPPAYQAAFLH